MNWFEKLWKFDSKDKRRKILFYSRIAIIEFYKFYEAQTVTQRPVFSQI